MTVADLVAGDSRFLDANIFIFAAAPDPLLGPACDQLLKRIDNRELQAFTSLHVLGEVAHRLMVFEATRVAGWVPGKVKRWLQKQPALLRQLTGFRTAVETILQSPIQILDLTPALLPTGLIVSQDFGLLVNDALIVALMRANGLDKIAGEDTDFDRVPGITRYAPA